MKKLSDYRIKEVNGNFIIETKIEFRTGLFKKKTQIEWVNACHDGSPFMQFDITCQSSAYYDYYQDNHEIKYKSLDDAKAKIVEWCDEPKYHYVREIEAYADKCIAKAESEMKGIIDTALAQVKKSFKCFPCDLSDIAKTEQQMKEEITEQDVVGACKKQFDEKLPSFKDCGYKSLCTLPLTVEEKNLELQLENAQYEKRIERLNILCCDLIEENRKLKKEIEIIRYNSENVIKSYIYEIEQLKAKTKK